MAANNWKYKNITLFLFSLVFALLLAQSEAFHNFLLHLGKFGYIGAFAAGMLFTISFTVATSIVIITTLADSLHPAEVAIISGVGAVVGDLTILRFIKGGLFEEIEYIYINRFGGSTSRLKKLLRSRYFIWTLPILGALLIASPFPDELGISLLGISRLKPYQFATISFVLNLIGILTVLIASNLVKL